MKIQSGSVYKVYDYLNKKYENNIKKIKNCAQNFIYFIITPYLLLKHFTVKNNPSLLQAIILILISTPLLSIYVLIIVILIIYKKISELILTYKFGETFLQFVVGHDAIVSSFDDTSGIVSVIVNIKSSKTADEIFEDIKKRVLKYFFTNNVNKKFFSTKQIHLGHLCLMHVNNITINDVLFKIKDKPNDFDEFLYQNGKSPLPKNGLFNWDISFYSHPYEKAEDGDIYAVQMRMNHILADGIIIYNIVTNLFSDSFDLKETYSKSLIVKDETTSFKIKTNLQNASCFISKPDNLLYNGLTGSDVTSCLFVEKTGEYFNKIKAIKARFRNMPFFGILMTAYSASLSEYFIKNSSKESDLVEKICLATSTQVNKKRISYYYCSKNYNDLKNDFSVNPFYIPIVPKDKIGVPLEDYMVERLLLVKKEFELIDNSSDSIVFYILLKTIFQVLPYFLGKWLKPPQITGVVSTVPGGPGIEVFNGDILYNINFFLPKIPQHGIALYVITYDNRLSLTLVGDKKKFRSKKDLLLIAKNTFKYLDILYEKLKQ